VELRDLIPLRLCRTRWNCRCQQNVASGQQLTSEGDRESAVNSARGKAEASSTPKLVKGYYSPSGGNKTIILQAQAERQQQVLKAQATAEALQILLKRSKLTPVLVKPSSSYSQHYLEMGTKIGSSDSSKVCHGPAQYPSHAGGMRSIVSDVAQADSNPLFSTELPPLDTNHRV